MNEGPKSRDEIEAEFFKTLTRYFSERFIPTGFFNTIGSILDHLATLNKNLEESNASSAKLSAALNKLTFWGVLVAATGVIVAVYRFSLNMTVGDRVYGERWASNDA